MNRIFYNTEAAEGGGGAVQIEQQAENTNVENAVVEAENAIPSLPSDVLKELEELRQFKLANTKEPEKSEVELAKEKEIEKADFIKFSVDNDLLAIEELTKYETLQTRKDAELVFESFLQDFKEENTDIEEEDELLKAAQAEFDAIYKLSSANEKVKEKGLAKLAKEAKEIRSPFESKVTAAKASFDEQKELKANMPKFTKFLEETINKSVPESFTVKVKDGEEEVIVKVPLTKEDKEEINKLFNTPKSYLKFSKSQEEAAVDLDKKIQGYIKTKKADLAIEEAVKVGKGIGLKSGSNVGAEHPFPLKQNTKQSESSESVEESNSRIARARQQYA